MTIEPISRAKRPRKAKPRPQAAMPTYAAMHETNAALCLASGFLAPRLEENAARDHHYTAGRVVLEHPAPSARSLLLAKGDLPYGVVLAVELDTERLPPGFDVDDAEVIPLSAAKRLVFADEQSRLEFEARTSAYADIPRNILPYEVDSALFVSPELPLTQPGEAGPGTEGSRAARGGDQLRARMSLLDRCAGGLAAAFSTLNSPGGAELLPALAGLGDGMGQLSSPVQLVWDLVARVDASMDVSAYKPLLASIVSALCELDIADGFSASSVLKKINVALDAPGGGSANGAAQRFVRFAQDVVALRRELPDAAFADVAGSAVPRGALLFLLNPEPETLSAVRVRTPSLGARTYLVAATLVGVRAGMARLPSDTKSDPAAFLAIPSFVLAATRGAVAPLSVTSRWEQSGAKLSELAWGDSVLAQVRLPPSADRLALVETATRAGIAATFSPSDGALVAEVSRDQHVAQLAMRPSTVSTFPRLPAIETILALVCPLPKRAVTALATSVNERASATGVHCRIVELGQRRIVELSAFLAWPASAEALGVAQEALWTAAACWLARPEPTSLMAAAEPAPGVAG